MSIESARASRRKWYHANAKRAQAAVKERVKQQAEWLSAYKSERGCAECGRTMPEAGCLYFVANDGGGRNIIPGPSLEHLRVELEGFVIVCASCRAHRLTPEEAEVSAEKRKQRQRAHNMRIYYRRRHEWLMANGPCAHCESWYRLEVDHEDPTKKESGIIWSWSQARRDAELAKCQVLCHECHKRKTREEARRPIRHGSTMAYEVHHCRCDLCRAEYAKRRKLHPSRRSRRAPLPPTSRIVGKCSRGDEAAL